MTQYALIFLLYLRELMRQFNGLDLEFMGQAVVVGSFCYLFMALSNEDTQFKNMREDYSFTDTSTLFLETFFNRRLLAKKLFNL